MGLRRVRGPDLRADPGAAAGPGWRIFPDGVVPGTGPGSTPGESLAAGRAAGWARVLARVARRCSATGDVALVSHGHALRVLTTVWLQRPPDLGGQLVLGRGLGQRAGHRARLRRRSWAGTGRAWLSSATDSLRSCRTCSPAEADDPFGGAGGFAEDADEPGSTRPRAPLAVRMRPRSLDEVVGQQHLLAEGAPLRRLVEGSGGRAGAASVILWGPPGTGKTTLAHLVARATGRSFTELSAVTAGVKDVRRVMDEARRRARPAPPRDGALPRRDPPVHQGPAGRAAARGREPLDRPGRGHDGEPVVQRRGARCCPVPCCCRCARWRTTTSESCCSAAQLTTTDWPARSSSTTRRWTIWSGRRVATPGARSPRWRRRPERLWSGPATARPDR